SRMSVTREGLRRDRICRGRWRLQESLIADRRMFGDHQGGANQLKESDRPGAAAAVRNPALVTHRSARDAVNHQAGPRRHDDFDRLIEDAAFTGFEGFDIRSFHRYFAARYRDARAAA